MPAAPHLWQSPAGGLPLSQRVRSTRPGPAALALGRAIPFPRDAASRGPQVSDALRGTSRPVRIVGTYPLPQPMCFDSSGTPLMPLRRGSSAMLVVGEKCAAHKIKDMCLRVLRATSDLLRGY